MNPAFNTRARRQQTVRDLIPKNRSLLGLPSTTTEPQQRFIP
ncbi:MAG TPA: hypothetical protein V6D06_13430 [Trichocoleus sp.]